jgi:hypothetical protein
MAPKNNYLDQYKDPRWQKKRLEIMKRDEFSCQSCNDTESTLNVHHRVPYRKNIKIWDYENDELITLCENCHKEITEYIRISYTILMGRCWNADSAMEMYRIMSEIDGMNPYQLNSVCELIHLFKKF